MYGKKSMKRQTKITKIFYLYTHAEKHVLLSGNIFKRVNDIINMLYFKGEERFCDERVN